MVEKAGRTEAPLGSHRKPGKAEHGGPPKTKSEFAPGSTARAASHGLLWAPASRRHILLLPSHLPAAAAPRFKPAGDRSSVLQGRAGCSPGSAAAVRPARCSARSAGPAGGGAQGAGGGGSGGGGGGGGGVRGGSAPLGLPPAGARGCSRAATRTKKKKKKAERRGRERRFPTGAGGPAVGGQPSVPGSSQSAARGPCRRWRRKPARGRGGPAVWSPLREPPAAAGPGLLAAQACEGRRRWLRERQAGGRRRSAA